LVDAGGTIVLAEGSGLAYFGMQAEQTVGRSIFDVLADSATLADGVRRALDGESGGTLVERGEVAFEIRFDAREDAQGRLVGALLFGEASERPAGERARPGLSLLLRQLPCAVWAIDRNFRITYAAGRPRESGLDPARILGSTIQDVLGTSDPEDPILECYRAVLGGSAQSVRYHFRGRHYDVHMEPLRDDEGRIGGCACVTMDVTERQRAEERSARSEARLLEAQRIAHVGSWEWEVESNRVEWSDELYRIYGLTRSDFAGTYEAFLDRVLPEDREHTRAVVFDAYRNVKPFVYDHRIVRPDGNVRMLHTLGEVVADAHGRVLRMSGACWDTTELWETTRERERSVSLLRATLESTADGLLVVDRSGKVVAHNQRLLDLWQLSREVFADKSFEDLLALVHDQLENGEACLRRVHELESQPGAESFDSLHFRDGRFFERYSRPQRIGDQIVGRVWSYRNVTERERLLRGALFLADASRLLASLDVEKALEAVARLTLSYVGDACAIDLFTDSEPRRLLVLSRDPSRSIAGELPRKVLVGNPSIYTVGSTSYMTVPLGAHGEPLGALSFAAASGRSYSEADLSLAMEIGRRAELALENASLYRKARDALAARDEFLSIAAHEIRGPITALQLAVQGLQKSPPTAVVHKMMAVIEREARLLGRFVDELLDVARIRTRQLHFVFGPVDLVEVTRDVVSRLATELSRSGSSLSTQAPSTLVGTWDRSRLEQIVTNLLSNATKFGLGKPIDLRIDSDGRTARLTVQDRGIGIPTEAQQRIFAPFERAVSARHYGGLGLGLYIVRSVVDGLGGSIGLQSEPGTGTTLTVTLPLTRPE